MKQIARLAAAAVLVAWAAGSVRASITPSYEDGGKTMVLDVAADDTLDIANAEADTLRIRQLAYALAPKAEK